MKLRKKTGQKLLCITLFFVFVLAGTEQIQAGQKLIIFHAGSLAIPFKQICGAFIRNNPGVEVIREAAGSRTCARKIADLERPCDIMASADYTVIEKLLIPEYANWNISFATNEMAIMYRPDSRYAKDVNGHNWYKILLKKDVEYGHSDPNSDPCGYRSQLVWQLAEKYYQLPGLYNRLKSGCPLRNIRPKETDLIALLEAGQLDYLFIYRSVCLQHHMPFVELPEHINLGSFKYADFYRQATIKITGKMPGSFVVKQGKPMVYGVTIPKNSPNPQLAIQFLTFLLGNEGQQIMDQNGQTPLSPPRLTGDSSMLPLELKRILDR
jgi:molybdate/tungstate transport system substrate-binding protein